MRHLVVLLAVALAALTVVRSVPAQKFQPKSIQFKGDPEYTDQELMEAAGLKKGTILSGVEMNGFAQKLMASGVFDNVAYKFDGQDLIFMLTGDPALYPVRLGNLPFAPGADLDSRLHQRLPLYHGKVPSEGGLLDDVRQTFEAMLAAEGVKATVAAMPYAGPHDHNKASAMSFGISAPAVRLGTIYIDGASTTLLPRLQGLIQFSADMPFNSVDTPAAIERKVKAFYLDQGFAAAKVEAARSGALVQTADAILVPFKLTIDEGQIYKIASIQLPPDALVTQTEADKMVASPNKSALGEALPSVLELIEQRYKDKGYLDLAVTLHPTFQEATGIVNYSIEIDPGAAYHVAYIKFDNVSDDLRSRLMLQWQLMPGEVLNQTYLDTFLIRAEAKDAVLRRSLAGQISTVETSADPTTHEVDVTFKLEAPQPLLRAHEK
jgi:outer membrane protein assembly factor BamA